MYTGCSNAFHQAVANGEKQMALFLFDGAVLTNGDIDVEAGVEFDDYFCTKEDIGIGEALSNELRFKIVNEKNLMRTFPFGEFTAMLGARIQNGRNTSGLSISYRGYTFAASGSRLTRNGTATSGQPGFAIAGLGGYDGKVYCFGASGQIYAVTASSGAKATVTGNAFMTDKAAGWSEKAFAYDNNILTIRTVGGSEEKYEFAPLGVFNADKPNVIDDIDIDMTCYDRMRKLDKNMDLEITYPVTLKQLLNLVCASENVPVSSASFINEGLTVNEKPDQFDGCTKRDVVRWIAEAAGGNARIGRDGVLKISWLVSTNQTFDEGGYTECRPYYYQPAAVSQLCVRDTTEVTDAFFGDGTNVYLIQDNPFLSQGGGE